MRTRLQLRDARHGVRPFERVEILRRNRLRVERRQRAINEMLDRRQRRARLWRHLDLKQPALSKSKFAAVTRLANRRS